MARRTKLLNRGEAVLTIYLEKRVRDARGNSVLVPDMSRAYTRRATVTVDRQTDAELDGQVSVKKRSVMIDYFPEIGSYALFLLEGEEWDLDIPPTHSNVSRTVRHTQLLLRSRNRRPVPEPEQE